MSGEIQLIEITFELPEWTDDERFEEETPIFYGLGHAYEGQLQGYKNENALLNGLFEIEGVKEACLNVDKWVTVEFGCDIAKLPQQVAAFQEKLRKFLQNKRRILCFSAKKITPPIWKRY